MTITSIYNILLDFLHHIYGDGFFSLKSLTCTACVLFVYYELCKDWIYNIGVENDYFNKEEIGNFKIREPVKKKTEIENYKEEEKIKEPEKQEQLLLYKMFNNKK